MCPRAIHGCRGSDRIQGCHHNDAAHSLSLDQLEYIWDLGLISRDGQVQEVAANLQNFCACGVVIPGTEQELYFWVNEWGLPYFKP